jgi:hypothetical protein
LFHPDVIGAAKQHGKIAKKAVPGVCDVTRLKYPWHNVGKQRINHAAGFPSCGY